MVDIDSGQRVIDGAQEFIIQPARAGSGEMRQQCVGARLAEVANRVRGLVIGARGVDELFGDILQENAAMRQLCRDLGFALEELPESSAILRATLKL